MKSGVAGDAYATQNFGARMSGPTFIAELARIRPCGSWMGPTHHSKARVAQRMLATAPTTTVYIEPFAHGKPGMAYEW